MSIGQSIAHGCPGSVFSFGLASRWRRTGQGFIISVQDRQFIVSFCFEQEVIVRLVLILSCGAGFGYSGWHCVANRIPATVLSRLASTSTLHASGLFMRVHELPMLDFLGWAEVLVLTGIIPLGFNVGTGINLFLRWFARGTLASSTTSTITTPHARTTSSKGQDVSPGCPRVFKSGCGSLETCIMVSHLVKSREQIRAGLD
jgi:hypothetical protein